MRNIFYLLCITLFACTYTQKIRDGKTAFERKQFAVAIPLLKKEFTQSKSRVEKGKIALLIAQSYQHTNQNDGATEWFKTAYDNQAGVDALKDYAYTLKHNENYKDAIETFKALGNEIGSPYEYKRDIDACLTAQNWLNNIKYYPYRIEKVSFNTKNSDYSPALYADNALVITSDRNGSLNPKNQEYKWTNRPFSDLFEIDTKTNTAKPFDIKNINTTTNEGTAVFNKAFTEMFFTRCDGEGDSDYFCKIYVSKKVGDNWEEATMLPFCQEKINYGHPALSADENTIYFSCNSPEGWGGYDIYAASRTKNGWDTPRILSRTINTTGNEKFPTIDADTLYFSSDYHNGMGGLDIFKSHKLAKDNWSVPQNLKPPINSGGDDFGFVINRKAKLENGALQTGYFTSNRNGGEGDDDIYRFEKYTPPLPPPPPKKDTLDKKPPIVAYKMLLDGYVLEKIYENPDNPNSKVLGRRPLPDAKVDINIGKETKTVTTDKDGHFSLVLAENTDYHFFASKPEYLNNEAQFSTNGIGRDPNNTTQKFEVEIVLDKIFKNKEIVLENIYYDYDKWDIRSDAQPTLDRLSTTLKQNPTIKIQLSSHTDCRGKDKYNEELSQKRAQSAVDYLISKGIEPPRLLAKGYGESAPADPCECTKCTEAQHQTNRRTTFKITE